MTEGVESDQLLTHLLAIEGGGVGWDRHMGVQSVIELCHVGSRPPWKGGVYTVRAAGSGYRLRPWLGRRTTVPVPCEAREVDKGY